MACCHHRQFFDPAHYRIVLFDQRGAGRSESLGSIAHNTTRDLIADLEHLRELEEFLRQNQQAPGPKSGSDDPSD